MFERFSHYLSYGATDQQTVRELTDHYDGLIVPGTVAAFQREGTGGFVLSLSATPTAPTYLIDPRFPLFQQALEEPKKSHVALAELLGAPELVREDDPHPSDFSTDLLRRVAENWVAFNTGYGAQQAAKFQKYADRLDEEVNPGSISGPSAIVGPYLIAKNDDWWQLSCELAAYTLAAAESDDVLRVVACDHPADLEPRLKEAGGEQAIVWVSDLNEFEVPPSRLAEYGSSIREATRRGQALFALYGGFFSVLLASVGLKGACHGIGYGEHRSWPELPQSGPPPPRYYVPRLHRYIGQDLAYQLWSRDAEITACDCAICDNGPPILDYHDLMKHSVLAREAEIRDWSALTLEEASNRFERERTEIQEAIDLLELPEPLMSPVWRATQHLDHWADAMVQLVDSER